MVEEEEKEEVEERRRRRQHERQQSRGRQQERQHRRREQEGEAEANLRRQEAEDRCIPPGSSNYAELWLTMESASTSKRENFSCNYTITREPSLRRGSF